MQTQRHMAIIGGGVSGLAAAYYAIESDPNLRVTVFDANPSRLGGKINTLMLDGQPADKAAEFIDTDQKQLIDLCERLKLPVIPSQDDSIAKDLYYLKNGKLLNDTEFNKAYLPLWKQVINDKNIIRSDPDGAQAKYLDNLSMSQYMQQLASNVKDDRPWWKKVFLFWKKPKPVDTNIINMIEQSFAGEHGQPASRFSALQFVIESGDDVNKSVIDSDAGLRIEGGTKKLIDALEAHLVESGRADFNLGAKAKEITRQGDKIDVMFEGADTPQQFDQIIMATNAHALAGIKGLEQCGMPAESLDTLQDIQYTYNTKISIKTKVPVINDGYFLSSAGYQAWNRPPAEVVFLVGDDLPVKYKGKELLNYVLTDYAKAHKTTVDQMFDTNHIDFNGPDVQNPCYVTPAPGQSLKLRRLGQSFEEMSKQGIGIVGTYVPGEKGSAGYMGHGIESAIRAVDILNGQELHKSMGVSQERQFADTQRPPAGTYVERLREQETATQTRSR